MREVVVVRMFEYQDAMAGAVPAPDRQAGGYCRSGVRGYSSFEFVGVVVASWVE